VLTLAESYDGDGRSLKRVETKTQTTPFIVPDTTETVDYYLRSSVLGGRVITELNALGQKNKTKVYVGSEVGAEQVLHDGTPAVVWKYSNPVTGSSAEQTVYGLGKKEYDPFGLELGGSDPYLQSAEPDYASMGGSFYRDGGNPLSGGNGCQWNGMPVPCQMFGDILRTQHVVGWQAGRNVNSNFLSSLHWVDSTGTKPQKPPDDPNGPTNVWARGGHWELFSFFFADPQQNTVEKPFSSADLKAIKSQLRKILTTRCQEFIDKLLTQAGGDQDIAPTTNILRLFELVNQQGGFFSATLVSKEGQRGFSSVAGAVGARGGAKVLLSSTSDLYSPKTRILYHAYNALSELTHVAGHKPSYYATGAFSDYNLGKVAHDVAQEMGDSTVTGLPNVDPNNDQFGRWSGYYHDIVKHFCKRD
jgi:hypothetical protein